MSSDPHSLTLVISSAHTGSSLLCRDIQSLGGLGFPKEYLAGLNRRRRSGSASERDVLERLAKGCQDDAPGVAAVKLLVPQAGFVYRALSGERADTLGDALNGVVAWARERFDRVLLVVLLRNSLDQAIARVVADATGTHHAKDVNPQILQELCVVARDQGLLQSVLSANADLALPVTYEELTDRAEESTARLVAHARAQGFEVHRDVVVRRPRKVVSAESSAPLRESFLEYVRTETGLDGDDSGASPQPVPQVDGSGR